MVIRFVHRGPDADLEVLIGHRDAGGVRNEIDALRARIGQSGAAVTSIKWFLSKRMVWNETPLIVLCRRQGVLNGAVLLGYTKTLGLPIGLARGGRRGETSVIAPPADQRRLLESVAAHLVGRGFAHTIVLTVPYRVPTGGDPDRCGREDAAHWSSRDDAHRLSLAGGLDATMGRLSYKLRRNLRYYQRRALGPARLRFVPDLSPAQRREAIIALAGKGRYPTPLTQARRWDHALQAMPGGFAMGLQGAGGEWLSTIVGWRDASATYIDWQLNDDQGSTATAMRSCLLEHEARRPSPALVFVGGTSPIWQRACEPAWSSDLLVIGIGPLARLLHRAYAQFRPNSEVTRLLQRRLRPVSGGREALTVDEGC